jgi:hypothetical protein
MDASKIDRTAGYLSSHHFVPALLHYEELKARANHQMEGFLITTPAISGNNTMVVMGGAEYEVQALARLQAEA